MQIIEIMLLLCCECVMVVFVVVVAVVAVACDGCGVSEAHGGGVSGSRDGCRGCCGVSWLLPVVAFVVWCVVAGGCGGWWL